MDPGVQTPRAAAGPVYLVDRQPFDWSLTTWLGVSDVAYMMVHWWDTTLRRRWERPILHHYHDALTRRGVSGYPWEQLERDYRLCAAQSVYVAVEWLETASPISTVCGNAIVSVPTTVHVTPSADCDAVMVAPSRVSRTQ